LTSSCSPVETGKEPVTVRHRGCVRPATASAPAWSSPAPNASSRSATHPHLDRDHDNIMAEPRPCPH
jgi:hypothetical protein